MRRLFYLLFAAGCTLMCTSCDDFFNDIGRSSLLGNNELKDIMLGYYTEAPSAGKHSYNKDNAFVSFLDLTQTQGSAEKYEGKYDGEINTDNILEYYDGYEVWAVGKPDNAAISAVRLVSADSSIVNIIPGDFPTKYKLDPKGVGETDLTLTVKGENTLEKTYHMRVNATTSFKVHVPKFWYSNILTTKLRYRVKDMPANVKSMYMDVMDSVTVFGQCEYYDYKKFGDQKQVLRDTITFPLKKHIDRFKKGKRVLLRNVTSAVREFNHTRAHEGTTINRYVVDGVQHVDTVAHKYPWITSQIELSLYIVSDNPYLVFTPIVKVKDSPKDKDDDDTSDGDIDDPDTSDDTNDKEAEPYFKFSLNDGLTPQQRDSIRADLQKFRDDNKMPEKSEAEQDSLLAERNKHM